MIKIIIIFITVLLVTGICIPFPVYAEQTIQDTLSITVKTDRTYYAPGDIIRVKGTITNLEKQQVNASVLFSFQGMKKTVYSGKERSFLTTIPISRVEPENLYKLEITAEANGYLSKTFTIPITIMAEPSSLAPMQEIMSDF